MMNYDSSFYTGYPTSSYHSTRLFTDDYLGSSSLYPSTTANTSTRLYSDDFLSHENTFSMRDRPTMLRADLSEDPPVKSEPKESKPAHEQSSVNVHTWLTEEKSNDQTSSHTEDEKREEPAAALPSLTSRTSRTSGEKSPSKHKEDPAHEIAFQMRHNSYFDSLFQGQIARRQSEQAHAANQRKTSVPVKVSGAPPSTRLPPQKSKSVPVKKLQTVEETVTPRAIQHHPSNAKNPDERYREALQRFRADRAEQQQRELNESTAKRLNYGKYVRSSTKDALLQNAKKPLPWTDFVYMRKGNVYTLTKEEKKDLFYLSKSYGERIRQRNFALKNGAQTARPDISSFPYHPMVYKPASNPEMRPKEVPPLDLDRTFSAPSSASSSDHSDHSETSGAAPPRPLLGTKYDSSIVTTTTTTATTTTATESERETSSDQREAIAKKRENLSTVREEKPSESSTENHRTKKR